MSTDQSEAFDRAAEMEYRRQAYDDYRNRKARSLSEARRTFHRRLNWLLFLAISLAAHWYAIQEPTNWLIVHAALTAFVLLSVTSAWGNQRVAEALETERSR